MEVNESSNVPYQQFRSGHVMVGASSTGSKNERLHATAVLGLAATQLVLGGVSIMAGVASILSICGYVFEPIIGTGIWTGVLFIVAGSFGIAAAKKRLKCLIITYMVLSIVAANASVCTLGFGAGQIGDVQYDYGTDDTYRDYDDDCATPRAITLEAMGSIMIICGVAEAVVAIISSALCCHAVCCCRRNVYVNASGIPGCQMQYDGIDAAQGGQPHTHRYPGNCAHPIAPPAYNSGMPPVQDPSTHPGVPQPTYHPLATDSPPQYQEAEKY